jgi:hypothetical protein
LPIWIDAICINQQETSERNAQVQLMREIYSTAHMICMWLGESNEHMIEAMQKLFGFFLLTMGIERYGFSLVRWFNKPGLHSVLESLTQCGADIGSSDFWNRLWITQEVVIGTKTGVGYLLLGQHAMSLTIFMQAIKALLNVFTRIGQLQYDGMNTSALRNCYTLRYAIHLDQLSSMLPDMSIDRCKTDLEQDGQERFPDKYNLPALFTLNGKLQVTDPKDRV